MVIAPEIISSIEVVELFQTTVPPDIAVYELTACART